MLLKDSRTIKKELANKGFILTTISGNSMKPLLDDKKDSVYIEPLSKPLKRGDVILYERASKQLVLHRIVKIRSNTYYVSGDNQYSLERVKKNQVLGIMTAYYKKENKKELKRFIYTLYKIFIKLTRPYRYIKLKWNQRQKTRINT